MAGMGSITKRDGFRRALLIGVVATGALLLMGALSERSVAATGTVSIRDNRYEPKEIRVDPGDSVIWRNTGSRVHTVTSDKKGEFDSGNMNQTAAPFEHRFDNEGYYFYFCRQHGSRGQIGMYGVVIVGDLPPPGDVDTGPKKDSDLLVVPDEFKTIQKAVNAARKGATVLIKPGTYFEAVNVKTPGITIKGVDRYRTILNGRDELGTGILVDGANNVTVTNLTVRNYLGNGVFFFNMKGYKASRIDSIKNRTYGIYAFDAYNGVFKNSFAWGSGDGGFYIGQCLPCSATIENVVAKYNYLGYSGTNATGVVIRDSLWTYNAVGIAPNTLPTEDLGPNRGTFVYNNRVINNNYATIPAAGFSDNPIGVPIGTGIWFAGIENNVAMNNLVERHESFGILVSQSVDESLPINNTVTDNIIRASDIDEDGRGWDLAWDGTGERNCFSGNTFEGETGPPDIESIYPCDPRTAVGIPYGPVQAYLAESVSNSQTREQEEPPEPNRPSCQRGAPGCSKKKR